MKSTDSMVEEQLNGYIKLGCTLQQAVLQVKAIRLGNWDSIIDRVAANYQKSPTKSNSNMKVFRNKAYMERDYECTNVIYCESEENPDPAKWVEEHESTIRHFVNNHAGTHLYTQAGARYYGYM